MQRHYRCRYPCDRANNAETSLPRRFIVADTEDVFAKRNACLKNINAVYIPGTMEVFRAGLWRPLPDPLSVESALTGGALLGVM